MMIRPGTPTIQSSRGTIEFPPFVLATVPGRA